MVVQIFDTWVEILFFVLVIFGIILALAAKNPFLSYLIIFLIGLVCGRLIYQRKKMKKAYEFPFYFTLSGLLLGYLIGSNYGNWILLIIMFIIGIWTSYMLHKNKYLD